MALAEVSSPVLKTSLFSIYTAIAVRKHGQRRKINFEVGRPNVIEVLDVKWKTYVSTLGKTALPSS